MRRMFDGHVEELTEVNEKVLKCQLDISDGILSQESLPLGNDVLTNWGYFKPSLFETQEKIAKPVLRKVSVKNWKDFKQLLLEAMSLYHHDLAKRNKYDFSSPKAQDLFKKSLLDCPFQYNGMELSFDPDSNQYVVKFDSKMYYICMHNACTIGLELKNTRCFKHAT